MDSSKEAPIPGTYKTKDGVLVVVGTNVVFKYIEEHRVKFNETTVLHGGETAHGPSGVPQQIGDVYFDVEPAYAELARQLRREIKDLQKKFNDAVKRAGRRYRRKKGKQ